MKKRVRIYKAGGEQGQYMNKTAQFLMKAQLGAERSTEEKMVDSVTQALSQGMSPEDIYAQLLQLGIDEESAQGVIQSVMESMQPAEEEQPQAQEGQEVEQEQNPVLAQYDTVRSGLPMQDEQEETSDEDDSMYYTPPIEIPDIQAYMPDYVPMADDLQTYDVDNPFSDLMYKNGGRVSKRNFVKNVLDLVKKQNGGDAPENKADNTDIPINGRQEKYNNFLGAIKDTAQNAVLKKAIGNMYNDMMQEGGVTDQASGKTMFQAGGQDEDEDTPKDLSFNDSKNITDPYFKYGGLATYQTAGVVDINKNGIPDYLEREKAVAPTANQPQKQMGYPSFYLPQMANRRKLSPFDRMFNYQYSYLKPTGNQSFANLSFDPANLPKPTNVELRRSGRIKEMDMMFDPSDKSNITSITNAKFRRSGMPKSFTINYKGSPGSTETNPAFDFMLSQYTANKEKQAEKVKSNGAPTGPGVAPWAGEEGDRRKLFPGRASESKETRRHMEAIDERIPYKGYTPFQMPTQPIDDSQFPAPVDWHDEIRFQNPNITDTGEEFMYGGYYAYGGDLPEYQGQPGSAASSSVTTNPEIKAQDVIQRMSSPDYLRTDIGTLKPKNLSQVADDLKDEEGLVNIGNTPKPELEGQNKSMDVKVKNKYKVNPTAALDTFNMAANTGLNYFEELQRRKANKDTWQNTLADNLYDVNTKRDRGTYEVNSGLFRPDEMGFNGVIKYGGPIFQKGGIPTPWDLPDEKREEMNEISDINMSNIKYPSAMLNESKAAFMRRTGLDKQPWAMTPNHMYSEHMLNGALPGTNHYSHIKYEEGGEAYMTDEEIENFLAEGGELEYIND